MTPFTYVSMHIRRYIPWGRQECVSSKDGRLLFQLDIEILAFSGSIAANQSQAILQETSRQDSASVGVGLVPRAACMLAMPISPFSSMGALVESPDAPALPQSSLNWSTNRLVAREDDIFRSTFTSASLRLRS